MQAKVYFDLALEAVIDTEEVKMISLTGMNNNSLLRMAQ